MKTSRSEEATVYVLLAATRSTLQRLPLTNRIESGSLLAPVSKADHYWPLHRKRITTGPSDNSKGRDLASNSISVVPNTSFRVTRPRHWVMAWFTARALGDFSRRPPQPWPSLIIPLNRRGSQNGDVVSSKARIAMHLVPWWMSSLFVKTNNLARNSAVNFAALDLCNLPRRR